MAGMSTAYNNNLFQSALSTPGPEQFDTEYEARYNPAYSSQPSISPPERNSSPFTGDPMRTGSATEGASQNTDEQAFAVTLEAYMRDSNVESALEGFAQSCLQHSRLLRTEMTQNQHRAARLMHLQAEASALEAEAATWRLLLHTKARMLITYPAGSGGLQTSVPTVHHAVARFISDEPELIKCARVVTWLEELASDSLQYNAEQGAGPRFHQNSGIWSDTQAALQAHGKASGLVSQLDPDAPTRQKASLANSSSRDEDTLNTYLFELVKAGQISKAAQTCEECGQPWRAASLLGGGPFGPEPLGPAAEQQAKQKLIEQLAAEVEANSSIALRSVWKWTCYQVAEAAEDRSHSTESAGQHEAALYAALASHVNKILPICQTRADVIWAYTRCWLATQVDKLLAESEGQDSKLQTGLSLGRDAVAETQRAHPEEVRKVVLDDVASFWPPSRLTEALPDTFAGVLAAADQAASAKPDGDVAQWQLHQDIIQDQFAQLLAGFVTDHPDQIRDSSIQPSTAQGRQQAARLRLGAHLALAVCYLPVGLPHPQDQLHVRTEQEVEEEPDPDAMLLSTSEDLALQNTVNQLLEQYVLHLIRTDQHALIPLYACHMRQDVRRSTYATYLHGMTKRSIADCQGVHQLAQQSFGQYPRGDIQGDNELADIVEQVMGEAFWRVQDGPNHWAATLRWLCFSDQTLLLAIKEANRVFRQLSLGGPAARQAAYTTGFEALAQSEKLREMLEDDSRLDDFIQLFSSSNDPQAPRHCEELIVWYRFYQLDRAYAEYMTALLEDGTMSDELFEFGRDYINTAIEVCHNGDLHKIWGGQSTATEEPHQVSLWVVPAGSETEQVSADVQSGVSYNLLTQKDQLAAFVEAVQQSVASCCVDGIKVEVKAAEDASSVAVITVQSDPQQVAGDVETRCLSAMLQTAQPLHVVRMTGPDLYLGALTSAAAFPHILLQAAKIRQTLVELIAPTEDRSELGEQIVPLLAGTGPNENFGLMYSFTQKQIQDMLELERQTQLMLMAGQEPNPASL